MGFIRLFYDWDLAAAEREFIRGLELAPNHPPAHYWLATARAVTGELDQVFAEDEKALALDPMSPFTNAHLGWMLLLSGEYDRSIQMTRKAVELNPNLVIGHMLLGQALILKSRFPQAIAELREAVRLSEGDAWMKGFLAYAYAASGRRDLASKLLEELRGQTTASGYRRSIPIALAYAGLGDKDRAFEFLDKAYYERDPWLEAIWADHLYDSLHSDPRWIPLIKRVGVVPENLLTTP